MRRLAVSKVMGRARATPERLTVVSVMCLPFVSPLGREASRGCEDRAAAHMAPILGTVFYRKACKRFIGLSQGVMRIFSCGGPLTGSRPVLLWTHRACRFTMEAIVFKIELARS